MPQGFDVNAARQAGYSDDEILAHLTQSRSFDVQGALRAGYAPGDIIDHLVGMPAAPNAGLAAPARPQVNMQQSRLGHQDNSDPDLARMNRNIYAADAASNPTPTDALVAGGTLAAGMGGRAALPFLSRVAAQYPRISGAATTLATGVAIDQAKQISPGVGRFLERTHADMLPYVLPFLHGGKGGPVGERDATRQNVPYAGEEIPETPPKTTPVYRDATRQNVPYAGEAPAAAPRARTPEPPATPQAQPLTFVKQNRGATEGTTLVSVDPQKLDAAWPRDSYYIGRGGENPGQYGRYQRFQDWLKDNPNKPIEAPIAALDPEGRVSFTDGRHRLAVLRDQGVRKVSISVPNEQVDAFTKFAPDAPAAQVPSPPPQTTQLPWMPPQVKMQFAPKEGPLPGSPEDIAETNRIQDQVRSQAQAEDDALRRQGEAEGWARNTRQRTPKGVLTGTANRPVKYTKTPGVASPGSAPPAGDSGSEDLAPEWQRTLDYIKGKKKQQ